MAVDKKKDIYKHKDTNKDTSELGGGKEEINLPNKEHPRKSPIGPKAGARSTVKGKK